MEDGARTRLEAFEAQQRQEERPFMGDATALELPRRARGRPRRARREPRPVRPSRDEGAAVLAGRAEWRGRPERWLGGVHLPPGKPRLVRGIPPPGRIV